MDVQHSDAAKEQPSRSITRSVLSWAFVVAWAGFIFFMSSNSGSGLNEGLGVFSRVYQALKEAQAHMLGPDIDVLSSIAHFCEYAVFAAAWANALRIRLTLRNACIFAVVFSSLYGITDELHQLFVPDRMCDPVDWLVDTAGSMLGSGLSYAAFRKRIRG